MSEKSLLFENSPSGYPGEKMTDPLFSLGSERVPLIIMMRNDLMMQKFPKYLLGMRRLFSKSNWGQN